MTPRLRCFRCRGRDWARVTELAFATCAYLILCCLGCQIEIAYKVSAA